MNSAAEQIEQDLDNCGIPDYMFDGVVNYILYGIRPGDFLTAVISNDLREVVGRADDNNINLLPNYIKFFYNFAPTACWGSKKAMNYWIENQLIKFKVGTK